MGIENSDGYIIDSNRIDTDTKLSFWIAQQVCLIEDEKLETECGFDLAIKNLALSLRHGLCNTKLI